MCSQSASSDVNRLEWVVAIIGMAGCGVVGGVIDEPPCSGGCGVAMADLLLCELHASLGGWVDDAVDCGAGIE